MEVTSKFAKEKATEFADILDIDDVFAIKRSFDAAEERGIQFFYEPSTTNKGMMLGTKLEKSRKITWVEVPIEKGEGAYTAEMHQRLMRPKPYWFEFWIKTDVRRS